MKTNRITKAISTPGTFSIVILLGLLVLLFGTYFSYETMPNAKFSSYLFQQITGSLAQLDVFFLGFSVLDLINIVAVGGFVFLLFRCNEHHSFIRVRTVMPCLLFVFLLITSQVPLMFCSGLWGTFFLLLALWRLMSAYQEKNPAQKVFDIFFLLAAGSFFSFELLFLVPVFWLSFPFFRITGFRTFMASVIGLVTPYILFTVVLALLGVLPEWLISAKQQFEFPISSISPRLIMYLIFLFLFFLFSVFGFLWQMNNDKIRIKQSYFFFFLLTISLFVIAVVRIQVFPLLALMFSITAGHYFTLNESRISFFWFIVFVLGGVAFFVLNR